MSFKEYIRRRKVTNNPAGDFVSDAKADPNLPDPQEWSELEAYLEGLSGLHQGVLPAAREVWNEYERKERRASKRQKDVPLTPTRTINVQIIVCPNGDELVVLPRHDYDALVLALSEMKEDAADVATYDARKTEMHRTGEASLNQPGKPHDRDTK